jgi:hypothetical protein
VNELPSPRRLKKTHKVLLVLLGVIVLAVIGFKAMQPKEPVFHGRKLRAWMSDLNGDSPAAKLAAQQVLRAAHKEILPFIETKLQTMADIDSVSKLQDAIWALQITSGIGYESSDHAFLYYSLGTMRTIGKDSVPTLKRLSQSCPNYYRTLAVLSAMNETEVLIELANQGDVKYRAQATILLGLQRRHSDQATQGLLQLIIDPEQRVVESALIALRSLQPPADQVVPEVIRLLDSKDFWIRAHAAQILGDFGTNAVSAVPKLKSLRQDVSGEVQNAVNTALQSIETPP